MMVFGKKLYWLMMLDAWIWRERESWPLVIVVDGVRCDSTGMSTNSCTIRYIMPVSILYKFIAGRYRPVRVADGPITARYKAC